MLFSSFQLKSWNLNSRIVLPPMATEFAGPDGLANSQHVDHYRQRCGAALIILEHSFICQAGRNSPGQLSVAADEVIPGLKAIADACHKAGAAIVVQINHAGAAARSEVTGEPVVGPSTVPLPGSESVPRELTARELEELAGQYSAAARRVMAAGFDGVELHGAHGYLLGQFLSPAANHRSDGYGSTLEQRMRFPLEVTKAVRSEIGDEALLLYRLGARDFVPGGLTLEDGCQAALMLEQAGIDAIDISAGVGGYRQLTGPGFLLPCARAVREAVNVPVINAGGLDDPLVADRALADGDVDLVAVGRAFLANPDWPQHARERLETGKPQS